MKLVLQQDNPQKKIKMGNIEPEKSSDKEKGAGASFSDDELTGNL